MLFHAGAIIPASEKRGKRRARLARLRERKSRRIGWLRVGNRLYTVYANDETLPW